MTTINGHCPACGTRGTLHVGEGGHITCSLADCPDPTAADFMLSKPDQNVHLIQFREDGYTCQHPLIERIRPEGLFACDLAADFDALAEPPGIGMFRVPPGGTLADMEQVDPEAVLFEMPTTPTSPEVDRKALTDALPIGSISLFKPEGETDEVPDGFMALTEERQAIPEDSELLLTAIADPNSGVDWPFFLDDGTPALPSAGPEGCDIPRTLTPGHNLSIGGEDPREAAPIADDVDLIMKVR